MNTYAPDTDKKNDLSLANAVLQKQNNEKSISPFEDNRSLAIVQQKLQKTMANHYVQEQITVSNQNFAEQPAILQPESKTIQSLSNKAPIQLFSVEEAPENQKIYSRSENMITGMESPNHEFYVRGEDAFPIMNGYIKQSPLELYQSNTIMLFNTKMYEVGLRYSTQRRPDEARKEQISRKEVKSKFFESDKKENLQKMYEEKILPQIKEYRDMIFTSARQGIDLQGLNPSTIKPITNYLFDLTSSLNLFKKVINTELANKGDFNEDTEALSQVSLSLIQSVEEPLYQNNLIKQQLIQSKQSLLEVWFDEMDREEVNVVGKILFRILDSLSDLIGIFPDEGVNMIPFHKYNFNREMLQKLYSRDNIALYRACDVQASTLLGNKITPENTEQLKNYNAGAEQAFHYATKIWKSGNDWVSLEHFAASERERIISGTENAKFKNLDHTWQFIMQGSIDSQDEGLSDEDKYFEVYTKIRYYLKGLTEHERGSFDTSIRERMDRDEALRFIQLGESGQLSNVFGWYAFYGRVSDQEKEKTLIGALEQIDIARQAGIDPLVHSKGSWDSLMELMR